MFSAHTQTHNRPAPATAGPRAGVEFAFCLAQGILGVSFALRPSSSVLRPCVYVWKWRTKC